MDTIKTSFSDIIYKVKQDFKLTNSEIGSILNCSESNISYYLSGKAQPSLDKGVLLKSFLESKGSDIYSKYLFDYPSNDLLYHGSREGINGRIIPNKSRRTNLDFGVGFYLGESFKQSSTFIAEEKSGKDRIYAFRFNQNNLRILKLEGLEWIFFVAYNRGKIPKNKENQKLINKMESFENGGYDVICGPIADDKMSMNMEEFFSNNLTYGQILDCLTQLKVGDQYCLVTQKACNRLKCINIYFLDDTSRYLINEYASNKRDEAVEAARAIASKSNDNGLKFEDLVKKYG